MCRARDLPGQVWEALFYIYTIIYSKLVLNQNGFLFSAELKCYFEERGKSNSPQQPLVILTKVNMDQQLFGNPRSSKYLLLCSALERN